jgi:hypothetical protein
MVLGLRGTSVGRAALGLRVVDHQSGEPIGVGPALLRTLLLGAGTLPTFGFGTASLAWTALADPARRGWHDHVTGSVVVDVRPPVVDEEPVEERPRHIVNLTTARLAAAPAQDPPHAPVQGTPGQATSDQASPDQASPVPTSATAAAVVQGRHVGEPGGLGSPLRSPTGAGPGGGARWVSFDTGESFAVEGRTLLGRRPEPREGEAVSRLVRLVSTDMSVSKTHAQLDLAPEGVLVVTDRGSTNGSVLVRDGVSRALPAGRPATLLPGDLVRFGDRQMIVGGDA